MSEKNNQGLVIQEQDPQLAILLINPKISPSEIEVYKHSADKGKVMRFVPEQDAREKIGNTLKLIWQLIEIRPENWPDPVAAYAIGDFIYRHYSGYSVQEIYTCFELALAGKIPGIKHGKNESGGASLEHYQSFGLKYFTQIFNAYIKFKFDAVEKAQKILSRPDNFQLAHQIIGSRPRNDMSFRDLVATQYREYLETENYEPLIKTGRFYNYLLDAGLVLISREDKMKMLEAAELQVKMNNQIAKNRGLKSLSAIIDSGNYEVKNLGKHMAVMKTFEMWKEKGMSPQQIYDILKSRICNIETSEFNRIIKLLANDQME